MQKIKRKIVKNIIEKISSVNQFDLLVYISQYQNDAGIINNLFYKDVCLMLKMSPQTFYNALYALEKKGFIILSGRHGTFDIRIVDNYFFNKEHYREGYMDLAKHPFVFSFSFLSQSLTTKKIALKLLLDATIQKSFNVGIEKIREWADCSHEEVLLSISALKNFFYISKKNEEMYSFRIIKKDPEYKNSNLFKYIKYRLESISREFSVSYTLQDLFDVYYIFKSQYKKFPKILSALYRTIREKHSFEPRLINYIVNN